MEHDGWHMQGAGFPHARDFYVYILKQGQNIWIRIFNIKVQVLKFICVKSDAVKMQHVP